MSSRTRVQVVPVRGGVEAGTVRAGGSWAIVAGGWAGAAALLRARTASRAYMRVLYLTVLNGG
ncbi:hypothetical protein GCM10017782_02790 [Deinococcus ficus]|nr:hypothetical protein GCM10017782_02790 [Deinococcus ficus]